MIASHADRRVLITGGSGFVGSRLAARLSASGARVVVIDNRSTGTVRSAPQFGVDQEAVDICDVLAVRDVVEWWKPTAVCHLAALHFIPECVANPRRCLEVNVGGTENLLRACEASASVESVVIASSAAVYRPDRRSHRESSSLGPTDVYGASKVLTERAALRYHARTNTSVGIARLFNVFGPADTNSHLIPTLLDQALRGDELHLGNLWTGRDYVFVEDVVGGLECLVSACRMQGCLTVNFGSETLTRGIDLVRSVEQVLGKRLFINIDHSRIRETDRAMLVSDCSRAHKLLQWRPHTDLGRGLELALLCPRAAHATIASRPL